MNNVKFIKYKNIEQVKQALIDNDFASKHKHGVVEFYAKKYMLQMKFLKFLGLWDSYIKHIEAAQHDTTTEPYSRINYIASSVGNAFVWDGTEEGYEFWKIVEILWQNYMKKHIEDYNNK